MYFYIFKFSFFFFLLSKVTAYDSKTIIVLFQLTNEFFPNFMLRKLQKYKKKRKTPEQTLRVCPNINFSKYDF